MAKKKPKKPEPVEGKTAEDQKAEEKELREALEKEVKTGGLKLSWVNFIKEYIKNGGNGVQAYMVAYPEASYNTAKVEAHRLLTYPNIILEIQNHLTYQKITDEYIYNGAVTMFENNQVGKSAIVGVKALELLAKMKGLMVDTKKMPFDGQNPAVFMPLCGEGEAIEIRQTIQRAKQTGQKVIE